MKIFIIGFMGSGKTTLGKPVARALGYDFVDMDHVIEQGEGMSVGEIFAAKGESEFRNLETQYLKRIIQCDNIVVSTGGGAPCFNNNMELMKQSGKTVYIKLSPAVLADRLISGKAKRPLIEGKSKEELIEFINKTLAEREKFYQQASIIVDNPNRDAERIINALKYQI